MTDAGNATNWREIFKKETHENQVFLYAKGEKGAPARQGHPGCGL